MGIYIKGCRNGMYLFFKKGTESDTRAYMARGRLIILIARRYVTRSTITNYIQIESKDLPISLSMNQTKNIKLLINDYYFGYLINHDLFLMLHRHDHYEDIESKKEFYCENCGHFCSFCSKSTKETKKYLFGSSVISNDKVHSIIFSTYFIIVNQNNGESRIYIKMNPVLIEDKFYIAS